MKLKKMEISIFIVILLIGLALSFGLLFSYMYRNVLAFQLSLISFYTLFVGVLTSK